MKKYNNYFEKISIFILLIFTICFYSSIVNHHIYANEISVLQLDSLLENNINDGLLGMRIIDLQINQPQVQYIDKELQTMEYLIGRYQFNATGAGIHASTIVSGNGYFTSSSHVPECAAYEKASGVFDGNSSGAYLDSRYNEGGEILKAYLVIESTYLKNTNNISIADFTYTFLHGDGTNITDKIESKLEIVNASSIDNCQRENGFIDVTDFVKKNGYGWYYACNLPWSDKYGIDSYSCWKLIVIEQNNNLPIRVLKLDMGNSIIWYDSSKTIEVSGENIKTKTEGEVTGQFLFSMNGADMYSQQNSKSGAILYSNDGKESSLKNIVTKNGSRTLDNPLVSRIMRNGYPIDQKINYTTAIYTNGYAISNVPKENYWLLEGGDLDILDIEDKTNHDISIDNGVDKVLFRFQTIGGYALSTSALGIAVDIDVPKFKATQSTIVNSSSSVTVTGTTENDSNVLDTGISNGSLVITLDNALEANTAQAKIIDGSGNEKSIVGIINNTNHTVVFSNVDLQKTNSKITYTIDCMSNANKKKIFNNKDSYSGNMYTNSSIVDLYIDDIALSSSSAIPYYKVTIDPNGGSWNDTDTYSYYDLQYGNEMQINDPQRVGYTFKGWIISGAESNIAENMFTMGTENSSLTATWEPNDNTKYIVNHWTQKIGGNRLMYDEVNYTLKDSLENTGVSDEMVTPNTNTYYGFSSPDSVTVKISPDGTTVVNYYYTRNKYMLTLQKDDGIDSTVGQDSYYFEEEVTIDAVVNSNYVWKNWTGYEDTSVQNYTLNMPAQDITFTANTIKKSSVIVKYIDVNLDKNIIDEDVINGLQGDSYKTENKEINGYKLLEIEGETSGVMDSNPKTIICKYAKQSEVSVKYIDEITEEVLHEDESVKYLENDEYTTSAKEIEGYTLTSDTKNTSGVMQRENIEVIYYYKKNTSITVKYVDKNNKDIEVSEHESWDGLQGDDYVTVKKDVEGYIYDSIDGNANGKLEARPIEITYYYVKKSEVITKYVDENSKEEISKREETVYKEGENYSTLQKDIDGYAYSYDTNNTTGVMQRENIEVTYYYKRKTSVIVKYIDINTEKEIAERENIYGVENQLYDTTKKEINNYKFIQVDGETSGNMEAFSKTITYKYAKESNVYVKYVDEITGDILEEENPVKYIENEEYTTNPREIEGYIQTTNSNNISGKVGNSDIEVIYYYKKKTSVTVKYIDMLKNEEIAEEDVMEGLEGQNFETHEKDIEGYELVDTEGKVSGQMEKEPIVVTYKYKKVSKLITEHIDANTNKKIDEDVIKVYKEGEEYEALAQNFAGYVLVESPEIITGTIGRENITKTFYYKKISAGLVIKYVDKLTGEILDQEEYTGNENDNIDLIEKSFEFYVISSRPEYNSIKLSVEPQEVIYEYLRMSEVIVEYIDQNTREILNTEKVSGLEGEKYTTNKKDIVGYEIIKIPENSEGIYKRENNKVVYEYKKTSGGVVVKYIDKETNEEIERYEIKGLCGKEYKTEKKQIKDYKLIEVVGKEVGVLEENQKEVIYYYEKKIGNVVIMYIDTNGEEIIREEISGKIGEEYKTEDKKIEGYKLVKTPDNEVGRYEEEQKEVVYTYEKLKIGKIIVNFVDRNGNKLYERIIEEAYAGEDFYMDVPEIEGYNVIGEKIVRAKFIDGEIIFDVKYEIIQEAPNTGDINVGVLCLSIFLSILGINYLKKKYII